MKIERERKSIKLSFTATIPKLDVAISKKASFEKNGTKCLRICMYTNYAILLQKPYFPLFSFEQMLPLVLCVCALFFLYPLYEWYTCAITTKILFLWILSFNSIKSVAVEIASTKRKNVTTTTTSGEKNVNVLYGMSVISNSLLILASM